MTDKVADDDYDDDEVIPWIASSKSNDQKTILSNSSFKTRGCFLR